MVKDYEGAPIGRDASTAPGAVVTQAGWKGAMAGGCPGLVIGNGHA